MADYLIPYFAPDCQLPSPLPSLENIESSAETIQEYTGRRTVRFGEHYIIKYGTNVSLTEGKNLMFIHQTQTIRVPKVFALYFEQNSEGCMVNYIIMERIVGQRLDTVWPQLDKDSKTEIASQLRQQFDQLRALSTPGFFGCIDKQPFEESLFWTAPEDNMKHISGPFDDESQLNDALIQKYIYNGGLQHKAQFYRHVFPHVLKNHIAVFTHGDLQRKNIILMDHGAVVLVDWEAAGWYPEYWEYALATFACGAWNDDWYEYICQILAEYPNEYAWFDIIRRELWS